MSSWIRRITAPSGSPLWANQRSMSGEIFTPAALPAPPDTEPGLLRHPLGLGGVLALGVELQVLLRGGLRLGHRRPIAGEEPRVEEVGRGVVLVGVERLLVDLGRLLAIAALLVDPRQDGVRRRHPARLPHELLLRLLQELLRLGV